jgi:hypothetical protein
MPDTIASDYSGANIIVAAGRFGGSKPPGPPLEPPMEVDHWTPH